MKIFRFSAPILIGFLVVACGGSSDISDAPVSSAVEEVTAEEVTAGQSSLSEQTIENPTPLSFALPAMPPIRAGVLDVNARSSGITHNLDLDSFDISFSIYSQQFVPSGDVTGDGYDDVLFTNKRSIHTPYSTLFRGHPDGWAASLNGAGPTTALDQSTPLSVYVNNGVGDINGDNRQDLSLSINQPLLPHRASISYILLDFSVVENNLQLPEPDGQSVIQVEYPGRIVERIEGIGDSNGDGLDDLLVFFSYVESSQSPPEAFVILGSTELPAVINVSTAQTGVVPLSIGPPSTEYAEIRAIGDVNGDALADFMISYGTDELPDAYPFVPTYGYGHERYQLFMNNVILGRDWRSVSGLRIDHESQAEVGVFSFEHTDIFEPLLDITGDGLSELLVNFGDWREKPGSLRIIQGRQDYEFYESRSEPSHEISWQIPRSLSDRFYGYAHAPDGTFNTTLPVGYVPTQTEVVSGGDFDGDGINDILIFQYDNGDYYHWRIGQYYIFYGDRSLASESRRSNATTLMTNAHGRPVVLGDIDNDGADDIGIATMGYPVNNRMENISLLVDEQSGEDYLSLTPYTDGPNDGHFEHDKSVLTTQIVLSPGLQNSNVSEAWNADINQVPILVDPDLLQSLMDLIEAAESIETDAENPLNWYMEEISRTPEGELASIVLIQKEGGLSSRSSKIEVSNNGQILTVETRQGYYSARTSWHHSRDCIVNLESRQILDHFYFCRDALSVAIQRLLEWK